MRESPGRCTMNRAREVVVLLSLAAVVGATAINARGEEEQRSALETILDRNNPSLWQRHPGRQREAAPGAFIEMLDGDRLPGLVVGFRPAPEPDEDPAPPCFLVKPHVNVSPPGSPPLEQVHVIGRFVRRVVWQRRASGAGRDRLGTVYYRDGHSLAFRSVRFEDGVALLLTEKGIHQALFGEIAELHMPDSDPWQGYYDQLAVLSPDVRIPLVQLEAGGGLILTSSLARLEVASLGAPDSSGPWWVALQPAWCLETLWLPDSAIGVRRMFPPHQVPLCRFRPAKTVARGMLGGDTWRWQTNRNAQGGLLRSGGQTHPWGFGAHAYSELHFPLPDCVLSARSRIGLDRVAGTGGCVRARVYTGSAAGTPLYESPLYESPLLVGSQKTVDTGPIRPAGPAGGQESLILQVDPTHEGRPAGADPLDVRDVCDWIDPQLILDPAKLRAEVRPRIPRQIPAWQGWTLTPDQPGAGAWGCFHDQSEPGQPDCFRTTVRALRQPLVLSRDLHVEADDRWLIVAACRHRDTEQPPKIEVRIDGQSVAEQAVPRTRARQLAPPPLVISLVPYRGRAVHVEIVQSAGGDDAAVHWRAIRICDQLPALYPLFEDDGRFVALDEDGTATLALVEEDTFVGSRAVKITPGGRFRLPVEPPIPIRERPTAGQYRYFRFVVRALGRGHVDLELEHAQSGEKPARYDAGTAEGNATHAWHLDLPGEWVVTTRDLYADFGSLDLTGLTLSTADGEYALFDHIYLARSQADFGLLRWAPSPELTNQNARRVLAKDVLENGAPAMVSFEVEGRRGTGVLVGNEGCVLTAAHVLGGRGKEVTVRLADGRTVKGETAGILRTCDFGVIKIAGEMPLPGLEISTREELEPNRLYVGFSCTWANQGGPPMTYLLNIAASGERTVATDYALPDAIPGGPLLDRDYQVVGVHTGRSGSGTMQFSKASAAGTDWDRLTRGEVWGRWLPGSAPMLGVVIAPAPEGCRLTAIYPDSPASRAELKADDVIQKVNGTPVATLADLGQTLAEKDPGDEVTIDVKRGDQTFPKRVVLMPRRDEPLEKP